MRRFSKDFFKIVLMIYLIETLTSFQHEEKHHLREVIKKFLFYLTCSLLEKKYQDHIRSLEDELHKTRETQATQSFHLEQNIIKELSTAQEQEAKLRDRIIALEQVNLMF